MAGGDALQLELIRGLFQVTASTARMPVLIYLGLILAYWPVLPWPVPAGCLLAYLLVNLGFEFVRWRWRWDRPEAAEAPVYANAFAAVAALSGLVWGVTAVLIANHGGFTDLALLCTLIAGNAISHAHSRAPWLPAMAGFIVLIALPMIAHLLLRPEPQALFLALTGVVLVLVCLGLGYQQHRRHRALVGLNLQNAELVRELERARAEAEAGAQAKADFLAVMSHEIRTPMNGILGMANLLLATEMTDDQRDHAETLGNSASALLQILDDILDFSKLDAGRLSIEPSPFRLDMLTQGCVRLMAPKAQEKGLRLILETDPGLPEHLVGDAPRLRQILLNLLANAIKFTERGQVTVTVTATARDARSLDLRFAVADTGIGISQEAQAHLFERFRQADSSISRRFGGTGLGLAICRRLVELMGGTIGVSSTPGIGSVFWFRVTLPIGAPPPPALSDDTLRRVVRARSGARPRHLLLVEDNPINRKVAITMLEKRGHTVETAEDGVEALERLDAGGRYDLILMDVHMPRMDGLATTRAIRRRSDALADTPIVALTADALPHQIEACLAAGMQEVLVKPFTPEGLDTMVARHAAGGDDSLDRAPAGDGTESTPTPTEPPLIDPSVVRELVEALGEDGVGEVMRAFLDHSRGLLADLAAALERGDATALREGAHLIKSGAGQIGLKRAQAAAQRLQTAAESGDLAAAGRHLEALVAARTEGLRRVLGSEAV